MTGPRITPVREKSKKLTPRELEVAICVAQGLRQKDICEELGIAIHTVKIHLGRVYEKTGTASPVQLCHWAIERGLVVLQVKK